MLSLDGLSKIAIAYNKRKEAEMAIKKSQSEKNAADTSVINPINEDGEQDGKTDAADSEEKAPPKKKTKKRGLDVSNLDE